jgi:myosin heavy subunit
VPEASAPETIETPDILDDSAALSAIFDEVSGDPTEDAPEAPEESPEAETPEEAEAPEEEEEEAPAEPDDAPEPEPEKPADDPDALARLERVAAAERELSRRRREFDEHRQELARMEQALKTQQEEAKAASEFLRELRSGDPLKALMREGIDFESLARGVATKSGVDPQNELRTRQDKLEQELRSYREAEEARARAAQEAQARQAAFAEIASVAEKRDPLIAAMGEEGHQLVFNLAKQKVAETGQVPTYDTLFEEARTSVLGFIRKFSDIDDVRALFAEPTDGKQTQQRAAPKTVSNKTAANPAKRKHEDVDIDALSPEEQYDILFG